MSAGLYLGVDIGTSRVKALLLDADGATVRTAARVTPFVTTPAGTEMTWEALGGAVASLLTDLGPDLGRCRGVGVSSLGESGAFVDAGTVGTPVIAWHDPRGGTAADRLSEHFGEGYRTLTGRAPRAATGVAKIAWLRDNGASADGCWLGVAGLLTWALTGSFAQEPSLAATSGAFDPRTGTYLPEVLRVLDLDGLRFPDTTPGGAVHGRVTSTGASWSGIPAGTPVTIAGHDHLVGALGAGAAPGQVADSVGSGEPVVAALRSGADADALRGRLRGVGGDLTLSVWPGSRQPVGMWEMLTPGLGLGRLGGALGWDRDDLEAAVRDLPTAEPLDTARIEELDAGGWELLGPPGWVRAAEPVELWARTLSGYAALAARADAVLRASTGNHSPTVVFGGGVRSSYLMRAKATFGVAGIRAVDEPEATARGAAVLAGVAAGRWTASTDADPARSQSDSAVRRIH